MTVVSTTNSTTPFITDKPVMDSFIDLQATNMFNYVDKPSVDTGFNFTNRSYDKMSNNYTTTYNGYLGYHMTTLLSTFLPLGIFCIVLVIILILFKAKLMPGRRIPVNDLPLNDIESHGSNEELNLSDESEDIHTSPVACRTRSKTSKTTVI